jgi:subtilase family serine protease
LQSAYNIDPSGGAGRTVALVEEGDAPTLEADLGVYRSQFGLPACTTANGCFRKVGQSGTAALPKIDAGWAQETSLDVDLVSAMCPNCNILVVEANTASEADLAASANTAAQLGAVAISNSYSGGESAGFASSYNHPGVAITASSGDGGFAGGAGSPADYSTVIAVGGTSLVHANNGRGWSESAWSGGGSACSSIISKPSWQQDPGCPKRMATDVSFVADTAPVLQCMTALPAAATPAGWFSVEPASARPQLPPSMPLPGTR